MDKQNLNTSKLTQSDHTQLIEFWREIFPNDPPHNEPSKMLSAKLKVDDLVFITKEEDKIVAACMAGYDGHRGWLYAVAVSPSHRRRGIGQRIIQSVIDELKSLGCIKLNLQIRADNTEVASFYQSLGFHIEERMSMGVFLE